MILFLASEPKVDFLDSLIGAAIILFTLSLINEKIVEFIRNYIKIPKSINRFDWLKNISTGNDNTVLKNTKRKEISLLAIFCGIGVAIIANASFFDLLTAENPREQLFWPNGFFEAPHKFDWPKCTAGMLFTGFFLSFGSRFFHDLLDTLCQTKELKRSIVKEMTTAGLNTIGNQETFDQETLANQALELHKSELQRKYPGAKFQVGSTVNNQIGIIANFVTPIPIDFPLQLMANDNDLVPTEAHTVEIAHAQYGVNCRVRNALYFDSTGSFGGVVVSDNYQEKLLLTCSHVALGGISDNKNGYLDIADQQEIHIVDRKLNKKYKGKLIYAQRDNTIDAALITLPDNKVNPWTNIMPDKTKLTDAISVDTIGLKESVFFYSSLSNKKIEGTIHLRCTDVPVILRYTDLRTETYNNLIVVGNNLGGYWSSMSEKGDSGSVLYTKEGNPFGIIIGGGDNFTYALRLEDVLQTTGTKLFIS